MPTDEQVTLDDDPLWTCNFAHSKGSFSSPGAAQLQPELGPGVPRRARGELVTGGARLVAGVTRGAARTRLCRELTIQVVGRTQGVEVDR